MVVEAGRASGALITLQFALEQGRETFAVPGNVSASASIGTNGAIQRGEAKLVTCVEDMLEELNLTMIPSSSEVREIVPERPNEAAAVALPLGASRCTSTRWCAQTRLPTAAVSSTLVMMELKGMVRRVDQASFMLAR